MTPDRNLAAHIDTMIEIGRRLWQRRLVAANDGNLSVRLDDDRVLTTATGTSKGFLERADLVVVDRGGVVVDGDRRPSTEIKMHLAIYDERSDVDAVVHAHPPVATGFAAARRAIPADVLPETIALLGEVPLVPYATPSTHEVPDALRPHVGTGSACLLANHGAVTWAATLEDAYFHMERLEAVATILASADRLGGAVPLDAEEIERLRRALSAST